MGNASRIVEGDVEIVRYEGSQVHVPEEMSLRDARIWLKRKEDEEEQDVDFQAVVDAFPLEGAVAFQKAVKRIFGFSSAKKNIFGKPMESLIEVEVGPNETEHVVWSVVELPGIAGYVQCGMTPDRRTGMFKFRLLGEVKKKHKAKLDEVIELTKKIALEEPLYKGRAIRVEFPTNPDDPNTWSDPHYMPRFIDTNKTDESQLVYSRSTEQQINMSVFTPILRTEAVRNAGTPLKRGVLLEGPYGTGKTMTAYVTAKYAQSQGWTFIYLEDVRQLATAVAFARRFQPAVVFAEDIDQVLDGPRDEKAQEVLNTIDGIESKDSDVMVVLTTNHVEKINPAMLRPGRLDAVITLDPPDAEAVERLLWTYGGDLFEPNADLTEAAAKLNGHIPATIRETLERAKLAAIARRDPWDTSDLTLTGADVATAAEGMVRHIQLLEANKAKPELTNLEKGFKILGNRFAKTLVASIHDAANHSFGGSLPNPDNVDQKQLGNGSGA